MMMLFLPFLLFLPVLLVVWLHGRGDRVVDR